VGSRGETSVEGLGDEAETVKLMQTLFTELDCRNNNNVNISHSSHPDSRPVCFTARSDFFFGGGA